MKARQKTDSFPDIPDGATERNSFTDALSELRAVRLAARRIVRDPGLGSKRGPLLVALGERARSEHAGDSFMLRAIAGIVWSEAREFLEEGITPTAPSPSWSADPVVGRLQAMRRSGLERCGECRRPIPSLDVLADWEDSDKAAWVELVRREEAAT